MKEHQANLLLTTLVMSKFVSRGKMKIRRLAFLRVIFLTTYLMDLRMMQLVILSLIRLRVRLRMPRQHRMMIRMTKVKEMVEIHLRYNCRFSVNDESGRQVLSPGFFILIFILIGLITDK
ncbi:hypothetical protein D3C80_1498450 [compost metagenome]